MFILKVFLFFVLLAITLCGAAFLIGVLLLVAVLREWYRENDQLFPPQ